MKKFEELERMQQELAVQNGGPSHTTVPTPSDDTAVPSPGSSSTSVPLESTDAIILVDADVALAKELADDEVSDQHCLHHKHHDHNIRNQRIVRKQLPSTHAGFTQEQLEELFKRTSAFTVKSAHRDDLHLEDELDDVELWRLDNHEIEDDDWREEEYVLFIKLLVIRDPSIDATIQTATTKSWTMTFGMKNSVPHHPGPESAEPTEDLEREIVGRIMIVFWLDTRSCRCRCRTGMGISSL